MNYQHEEEAEGVEIVPNAWSSELPTDILGMITDNLSLSQFIRFGSVCLGWRSFTIENYQHIKLPNKLPVLLIPIPPSLLLLTHHHHQKNISFPDDDEEEEEVEEEEELELDENEEKVTTDKEEEKETEEENDIEKEEIGEEENDIEKEQEISKEQENDIEKKEVKENEEEKEIGEEKEEEEEEDEDEEEEEEEEWRPVMLKNESYYDPKEIWQGQNAKQRYKSSTRTFYSLSEKMVYHDFRLPVPYFKNVLGSSYGWLVTVQERYDDNEQLYLPVSLINPFRTDNNEIQLPPITNGNPGNLDIGERIKQSYFLKKVILSANPSSLSDPTTQLVVFGIYGFFRLAFCRPCDKAWTRLDLEDYRPIQDVICYQGQVYAILQNGWVFAFVLDASQSLLMPIVTLEIEPPNEVDPYLMGILKRYLVESGGDLLQIRRNVDCTTPAKSGRPYPPSTETRGYITRQFLVFKLDPTGEWVEMKTLDDHMLFIGTSSSMSLSASDFPGWSRPNSIYYTDDHAEGFLIEPLEGPHDMGIFNLEDGSFERHYEAESMTVMPPPIWIQPML